MLLATACPGCGRVGEAPCRRCRASMGRSVPVPVPPSLDRCRALLAYEGAAREVVAQLKYRNVRSPAGWLAQGMATLVRPHELTAATVVTWAPTTAERRRRRGFDQAELLARRVAREVRVPCRSLLARGGGPAQTGRNLVDRRSGPAFTPRRRLDGALVILVDDVVTTGATFEAAGVALRAAGAACVIGLAAAHPA